MVHLDPIGSLGQSQGNAILCTFFNSNELRGTWNNIFSTVSCSQRGSERNLIVEIVNFFTQTVKYCHPLYHSLLLFFFRRGSEASISGIPWSFWKATAREFLVIIGI